MKSHLENWLPDDTSKDPSYDDDDPTQKIFNSLLWSDHDEELSSSHTPPILDPILFFPSLTRYNHVQ